MKSDICLILEGTYPYVTGGVSSWVHDLIRELVQYTFSLVVILPRNDPNRQYRYTVPDNVLEIQEIYLHDCVLPEESHSGKPSNQAWSEVLDFHGCPFKSEQMEAFSKIYHKFFNPKLRTIAPAEIIDHKEAWSILAKLYQENADGESFIDYFWTYRFIHLPMFKIMSANLPNASIYHSLSTGYAGLLAAVAKLKNKRPVILTEHGIYTRERRFEISRADWIYEKEDEQIRVRRSQSRFKALWNKMFATLSRICYDYADEIITLFEGNRTYQLQDGATQAKTRLIPNGIDLATFGNLQRAKKEDPTQLVIGFMGRVVSIKDTKTFIRVCKTVANELHHFKAYIMGPTDEEPMYFEECVKLVEFLGLKNMIEFTGKVDVMNYYPKLDIVVVTSISEAQPLVVLEANSMGIPVVATNVGACSEMLYGRTKEDKEIGKSGLIAGITDSDTIAKAVIKIWRSPELYEHMAAAGKRRVATYYDRSVLHQDYRLLYAQYLKEDHEWPESALS